MESLLPYLLPLLLLPLSLYLVSIVRKKGSDDRKSLPPGSKGWPILGEAMAYGRDGPEKFMKERMEKWSAKVFQTSLLGERSAVFCGAQGNKFLFTNESKLMTTWLPPSMRKVFMLSESNGGQGYLERKTAFKRIVHHAIQTPEILKQYIPVMDALAGEELEREWKRSPVVKVLPLSKKYTVELSCRLFLGVVDPVRIKKLSDPFTAAVKGMFSVPIDLPGTAYSRAIKGGKMVVEELLRMIKERREEVKEKGEGRDLLSMMVMVRGEDGQLLSYLYLANLFIGFLFASFETTSSAITGVINYLAQLPHIYDQVFQEQMAIARSKGPDEMLTWEDIEKMKYSWNVVRESMRLTPPAHGAFRETTTEFTYAGFTIPKGWKTFWTVYSSHKNPDYFPEPEKFDPSRFEGSGPPPYTYLPFGGGPYLPFGGGPRMCPGREYAKLGVLVFLHNVVTRFKLEKTIPNEKIVLYASPTPVHGLPLRLHPHQTRISIHASSI